MNTIVVWVMVMYTVHSNGIATGMEFSTQAKCEQASEQIIKAVDASRWGANVRKPLCVRIEK